MSSLLKSMSKATAQQTAQRDELQRIKQAVEDAAFESDLAQIYEGVSENLEEMLTTSTDISAQSDELMKNNALTGTLTDLVDSTLDTYGKDGMTEQAAELMRVSVESILRSAQLFDVIPVSLLVPSFESGMTRAEYSVEAEEKKQGMLARMLAWIAEAFSAMWTSIKSFFQKFAGNVDGVKKYAETVQTKVNGLAVTSATKEVNLGNIGIYLADNNGTIVHPDKAISAIMADFQTFSQKWDGSFGNILKIEIPSGVMDEASQQKFIQQLSAAVGNIIHSGSPSINKLNFIPSHQISIVPGQDKENSMIGSTLKIEMVSKVKDAKMGALTKGDLTAGINAALAGLVGIGKIQTKVDEWDKYAAKIQTFSKNALTALKREEKSAEKRFTSEEIAAATRTYKTLVAANSIMISGWVKTVPQVLTGIKASVRVIDMAVGRKDKNAEGSPDKFDPTVVATQ